MPPSREQQTIPQVVDIDGQQLLTSIDPESRTHYIDCHRCGDSIALTVTGHPRNFYNHINGKVCRKNLSRSRNRHSSTFHRDRDVHWQTSSSASPISNAVSGIISSFSNLHASSPNPTPAPEMLDSRVLCPHASHSASVPSILIPKLSLCPGAEIVWVPGSIWSTYPYHQHLIHAIGWTPASFDKTKNKIYLRSDKCAGELSEFDLSPCVECRVIPYSSRFKDFMQRAQEAMEHTPWGYLTSEQLQGLAKRLVYDLNKLRTKVSRLLLWVKHNNVYD